VRDIELYRHLLGIASPWTVTQVELSVQKQRVDVWAGHDDTARWACPECASELAVYDHAEERVWRHLDSCQFQTYLHARPPRVQCPTHGVRQVRLPWAAPRSRFTTLFERLAIDVLRESDISGVTAILRISWDEAWHLLERAVARGQARKERRLPRRIGVDEKAMAKGHRYLTLVCDLETPTIEYVAEDRKQASLEAYFTQFTEAERAALTAVALDMWAPYEYAIRAQVPQAEAKMVFDRFHIMSHMNQAVDRVRRREHRELRAQGDERLTGTKHVWGYGEENVPDKHRERLAALTARGMTRKLKTTRAWSIKESLRDLWQCRSRTWAEQHWRWWYGWAVRSRLAPVQEVARMLKRHLPGVLTYFRHRVTNAASEGLNSKIQRIKKMAYGFRNTEHFKTAIFFHCGGLDLYPATH
jgi:transposase